MIKFCSVYCQQTENRHPNLLAELQSYIAIETYFYI